MRREAALKERAAARKVRQLTRTNSMSHQQTENLFVNPKSSRADAVAVRDAPGKERRRSSVAAATSENDERFLTHRDPLPQEAHRSSAESSSSTSDLTAVYL